MISNVLLLIQTLFDIVRFRQGPDAIPYSPVLLVFVATGWFVSGLLAYTLMGDFSSPGYWTDTAISVIGVTIYSLVIVGFGRQPRLTQALTAIFGCAALLTLLFALVYAFLNPLLGDKTALRIAILVGIWSIAVDGHIVARTLNRELLFGLMVSIGVFLVQVQIGVVLRPPMPGVT